MYVCLQELHATIEDLQQLRITVCIVGAQVGVVCSGCGLYCLLNVLSNVVQVFQFSLLFRFSLSVSYIFYTIEV